MTTFERVGFIGLGGMGRGLVKNLVAKGVAVTAYDLNPAAVAAAKSFGAPLPAAFRRSATIAASS
jgi:2-hydroxy-3-oxopropionate reductase